jgi:hypothetical protein
MSDGTATAAAVSTEAAPIRDSRAEIRRAGPGRGGRIAACCRCGTPADAGAIEAGSSPVPEGGGAAGSGEDRGAGEPGAAEAADEEAVQAVEAEEAGLAGEAGGEE